MSIICASDTDPVTDQPWARLYRIVEERRRRLDLTQAGIQAVGGPSPAWLRKLPHLTGEPTARMAASMADLDRALQWPPGTSWSLVNDDRSDWSEAMLESEEHDLVEPAPDAVDHFAFVIAFRLRAIPEGPEREDAMRRVLAVLDVRP